MKYAATRCEIMVLSFFIVTRRSVQQNTSWHIFIALNGKQRNKILPYSACWLSLPYTSKVYQPMIAFTDSPFCCSNTLKNSIYFLEKSVRAEPSISNLPQTPVGILRAPPLPSIRLSPLLISCNLRTEAFPAVSTSMRLQL